MIVEIVLSPVTGEALVDAVKWVEEERSAETVRLEEVDWEASCAAFDDLLVQRVHALYPTAEIEQRDLGSWWSDPIKGPAHLVQVTADSDYDREWRVMERVYQEAEDLLLDPQQWLVFFPIRVKVKA